MKSVAVSAIIIATAVAAIAGMANGSTAPARVAPNRSPSEGLSLHAVVVRSGLQRSLTSEDTVVLDDHVAGVYALRNTLLYGRYEDHGGSLWPATDRRWMRVVGGQRRRVHGIPQGATPFSIGLDRAGRVVVVLGRPDLGGTQVSRWWLYDVVRDVARRLKIPTRSGCVIRSVAIWRDRMAYQEDCRPNVSHVVLSHERRNTRLMKIRVPIGPVRIALRHQSLAVVEGYGGETWGNVWRVLDRGQRCPRLLAGVDDELGIWAGVGSNTLTWLTGHYDFDGMTFSGLDVRHIDLSGRCASTPTVRHTPAALLPQTPINANGPGGDGTPSAGVAIDGRTVYYATDTGIYRLRLPA